MISALSGSSNAARLIALFSRPQNQTGDTTTAQTSTAQRPPSPPRGPPPSGGNGTSAQALIAAMMGALTGDDSGTAATTTPAADRTATAAKSTSASDDLSQMLSKLLSAMDTNGDGTLSRDEMKTAIAALQSAQASGGMQGPGGPTTDGPPPDGPPPGPPPDGVGGQTASASTTAKSLYQSLFDAMAAEDGNSSTVTISNDLAKKFMASLQATA